METTDTQPTSEWGIVCNETADVVNTQQSKRLFVIDDFYADPYKVREFALQQMYYPGEGAVGSRTRKQFLFKGIRESFESIIGKKIQDHTDNNYGWKDEGSINGRFQSCTAGTPSVYHCDEQRWAAIIFLTPDAPPESGTSFYRHKKTKVFHNSQIDWSANQALDVFNQKTFLDGTPYETLDTVANVFNRLVIFDGGLIHSGINYFGWDIPSSRLFHIFFFDTI